MLFRPLSLATLFPDESRAGTGCIPAAATTSSYLLPTRGRITPHFHQQASHTHPSLSRLHPLPSPLNPRNSVPPLTPLPPSPTTTLHPPPSSPVNTLARDRTSPLQPHCYNTAAPPHPSCSRVLYEAMFLNPQKSISRSKQPAGRAMVRPRCPLLSYPGSQSRATKTADGFAAVSPLTWKD